MFCKVRKESETLNLNHALPFASDKVTPHRRRDPKSVRRSILISSFSSTPFYRQFVRSIRVLECGRPDSASINSSVRQKVPRSWGSMEI